MNEQDRPTNSDFAAFDAMDSAISKSSNRRSAIRTEVSKGVVDGLKAIAADDELVKKIWERGFNELLAHASDTTNQWVGKRVLTWVVGVVVTAGFLYLVKTGAFK